MKTPWPKWYNPPALIGTYRKRISSNDLIRTACELTDITFREFKEGGRSMRFVEPRQAVVYVLHRRRPDLSWPQIARIVGKKDHSTVIHAHAQANIKRQTSPEFARLVQHLEVM